MSQKHFNIDLIVLKQTDNDRNRGPAFYGATNVPRSIPQYWA